jgi:hypothetical protein
MENGKKLKTQKKTQKNQKNKKTKKRKNYKKYKIKQFIYLRVCRKLLSPKKSNNLDYRYINRIQRIPGGIYLIL